MAAFTYAIKILGWTRLIPLCLNIVKYANDGKLLVIAAKNARIAHISPCGEQLLAWKRNSSIKYRLFKYQSSKDHFQASTMNFTDWLHFLGKVSCNHEGKLVLVTSICGQLPVCGEKSSSHSSTITTCYHFTFLFSWTNCWLPLP